MYDISMMTHIPNLVYLAPRDGKELNMMMDWAIEQKTTIVPLYVWLVLQELGKQLFVKVLIKL